MDPTPGRGVPRRVRRRARTAAVTALALAGLALAPAVASADVCPTRVDPTDFTTEAQLKALNQIEQDFGPRPTASPSQHQFVDWLEQQMGAIPGVQTSSLPYVTDRWDAGAGTLTVGGQQVRLAGPIPFTASTGSGGVTGPVVHLASGQSITPANAAGKIVVRDLPITSLPNLLFYPPFFGFSMYDPDNSTNLLGAFESEQLAQSAVDAAAAKAAGAKALLMVSRLPQEQFAGSYAPYEGQPLEIPGAYLSSDEGKQVKDAAAATPGVQATLTQEASFTPSTTRTLLATLPGGSAKKVVVESHTDGMNGEWDNGPIAMIAMARYFASLPVSCRPETIQFAFVTGHLHQHLVSDDVRNGGAGQLAITLDQEYDQGKVKGVVVIEHLGARRYEAVDRPGHPGKQMQLVDQNEMYWLPVSESLKLRQLVVDEVQRRDLRRTAVLKGLDVADLTRVPQICSFGGEGTPYNQHLLPTVAGVALPGGLFSPQFGLEAIDFDLMRRQSIAFTDIVSGMSRMSQADVAGDVTFMRQQRAGGAKTCAY
ncbi:PA domain-containing protein [Patulibacter defluvii]|uniref:PA domain-containing protein n=1 Tax=Patulibacter defluvii TaxID=3095358 RepID=UPI002A75376B|nr:PA domain-containing protein [Patulibacter sp. DM4]